MGHPLDGARERLKRADEQITMLDAEINTVLQGLPTIHFVGRQVRFTDEDSHARFEILKEYVASQHIPPRWSVLAGEVFHHLRSAFDHVAWQLSSADARQKFPTAIAFPVFSTDPGNCVIRSTGKREQTRYCRNIEGISNPIALARIESLQPYKTADPLHHPLWLIHDLDKIDKHRELVVLAQVINTHLEGAIHNAFIEQYAFELRPHRITPIFGKADVKVQGKISVQISLGELGEGNNEPIVKLFHKLLRFARKSIESFAGDFL